MKTDVKISLEDGREIMVDLVEEDLSWEVVETDEREMGVERLHEAFVEKEIEGLNEPLGITLHVWEYPEGFVNMQEIETSEGEVVEECDLGQFVISYYEDDEEYDYGDTAINMVATLQCKNMKIAADVERIMHHRYKLFIGDTETFANGAAEDSDLVYIYSIPK